jgi:hypothetical protein
MLVIKWLQLHLLLPINYSRSIMQARCYLPNNGLSEVTGIVADAMFKNMVILRRIVTPGMKLEFYCIVISLLLFLQFDLHKQFS